MELKIRLKPIQEIASKGRDLLLRSLGKEGYNWGKEFTRTYPLSATPHPLLDKAFSGFTMAVEAILPASGRGIIHNMTSDLDNPNRAPVGNLKVLGIMITCIASDTANYLLAEQAFHTTQNLTDNPGWAVGAFLVTKLALNTASHLGIDIAQKVKPLNPNTNNRLGF